MYPNSIALRNYAYPRNTFQACQKDDERMNKAQAGFVFISRSQMPVLFDDNIWFYLVNVFFNKAVFNWVSKANRVYFGFALLCFVIG